MSWGDCVAQAQKNNPDLISAGEQIEQSIAIKGIDQSGLLPQVSADLNASTAKTKPGTKPAKTYDYGVSASQLVFDGFKTVDEVRADAENIKASRQAFRYTSSEVRLRLRTAFVNLLRAQEMLNVAQDIYEIRRANLELITLRYESGLEHKGALLTAQADVAQAQLDIAKAGRDLEVRQRQLLKEMGRSKFEALSVKGDFLVKAGKEKPDFEQLAQNNPSLLNLVFQKNAALYGVKGAYANFFPVITAQAGAGRSSSRWPPHSEQWDFGGGLSWPLFEGGLKAAQLAQAKAVFRQYQADEKSTRDAAVYTLEETWAAMQDAVEAVGVEERFLEATQVRSYIAESQYSLGLMTFDNWTIIQDDLVQSKQSLLNSRANALLAEANWVQAKGETLEYVE